MYKLALSTVFLTAEEDPCIQYCVDSAMLLKLYQPTILMIVAF